MKKFLLSTGLLCFSLVSIAQPQPQPLDCTVPVGTLNQNFSTFEEQSFPQKCWTASTVYPNIYINNTAVAAERNVSIYTSTTPNTPFYVVSPELNTIDGIHALSFNAFSAGPPTGAVTVQVGTLTDAADYSTFVAVGEPYTLTATATDFPNILFPASETAKFVAFKVIATAEHLVGKLDNIVWKGVPATCTVVETLNENFSNFTDDDLTLNCWSKSPGTPMFFISQEEEGDNKYASFYTLFSANVDAHLVTPELSTIDGNHQLTFDAGIDAGTAEGSTATLQVGTLTVANDYTTFVAAGSLINLGENQSYTINIPASETAKYIAFRFNGSAAHTAATLDNVVWDVIPVVCTAQETLDENFNSFTQGFGVISENCWSAGGTGLVYIAGNEESTENAATFYAMNTPNFTGYLVSPELSTIDGNHELSFDATLAPPTAAGSVTLQLGTLATAGDFETFVAFGDVITFTSETASITDIIFPASETQKYIAFKVTGTGIHDAATIDNVKWTAVTAGAEDFTKTSFSIYPNPTADKNVTINSNIEANGTVSVYTLTGAKVFAGELNTGAQTLNLSSLSAGMYIVKIESGNYAESKKLIIK